MDVAHLTGFHEQFTHASSNRKPNKEETVLLMAALIGMGTNIGLSKMADATPGVTINSWPLSLIGACAKIQ